MLTMKSLYLPYDVFIGVIDNYHSFINHYSF